MRFYRETEIHFSYTTFNINHIKIWRCQNGFDIFIIVYHKLNAYPVEVLYFFIADYKYCKHGVVQLHRRQQLYKKCTSILDINFLILLLRNAPYRAITVYMKNLLCSILAYLEFPHHRAISILVYHFCLPKPQNVLNKKVEILIKQAVI